MLRLLQERTCLTPDRQIQEVRPNLVIAAHAFTPESVSIGPKATVVGVAARVVLACGGADRLAILGVAALGTAHQALQQVARSAPTLASMASIVL